MTYSISDVAALTGFSMDTLRYYEKINLLPPIRRNAGGRRCYNDTDTTRLRFIRRAQMMNFSLKEIGELLRMRDKPQRARNHVRQITCVKIDDIELRIKELTTLRNELQRLVNLCQASEKGCPILEGIEGNTENKM